MWKHCELQPKNTFLVHKIIHCNGETLQGQLKLPLDITGTSIMLMRYASGHLPTDTTKFWSIFEGLTSNHYPTFNTNFSTKFSSSLFWTPSQMDHKVLNLCNHDAYYLPPAHMEHKILICLGKKFISTNSPHRQQSYSSKLLLLTTFPLEPKSNK